MRVIYFVVEIFVEIVVIFEVGFVDFGFVWREFWLVCGFLLRFDNKFV